MLRPDGTVFATGSRSTAGPGHTAIYTPPVISTDPGTWTAGLDFPGNDNAGDSFAVLLPSGNVLVLGNSGTLYEFDGKTLTASGQVPSGSSLLVLPTAEVIVGGATVQLFTSAGQPSLPWAPTISAFQRACCAVPVMPSPAHNSTACPKLRHLEMRSRLRQIILWCGLQISPPATFSMREPTITAPWR